jgi:hypothetical protein
MTHDEMKRRADALYQWALRHHADLGAECPVCRGIKWAFDLEAPGRYVPRVCVSCGYLQWLDAKRLGLAATGAEGERFETVLAAYLEAVGAGWAPTRSQLMTCYPELTPELKAFFANTDRCLESLRSASGVPRPATGATGNGDDAP